jgi:mono/diheme cytochrome c family protein
VKRFLLGFASLAALGAIGFLVLTEPAVWRLVHGRSFAITGERDLANGQELFHAGGCVSCHMSPGQDDRTRLGGGQPLPTPFGTFYPPNISSDREDGIGAWSAPDFVRAMREGTSPDGRHYYPAFPYTSYQHMSANDLADLLAYLQTLPAVTGRVRDHDLSFPYTLRRGLGLWKLVFLRDGPITPDPGRSPAWNRGRYLVESASHCAECHSPRNVAGAIEAEKRFAGGPNPEGKGIVPNITPDKSGIVSWSAGDIAELLKTGFTPDFDSVGGAMAPVVRNTAQLTDDDRAAMAEYLKSLPARPSAAPKKPDGAGG